MELILILLGIAALVVVLRLFGAWMLRIDEIINLQKEMLEEMRKGRGEDGEE